MVDLGRKEFIARIRESSRGRLLCCSTPGTASILYFMFLKTSETGEPDSELAERRRSRQEPDHSQNDPPKLVGGDFHHWSC